MIVLPYLEGIQYKIIQLLEKYGIRIVFRSIGNINFWNNGKDPTHNCEET